MGRVLCYNLGMSKLPTIFTLEKHSVDFIFAGVVGMLIVVGLFVFFSASLQSIGQAKWNSLMIHQLVYSLIIGGSLLFGFSHFHYKKLSQFAIPIFVVAYALCLLVFIPGIGMSHGGGQRWIDFGFMNFQPGETLKFATVVFFAVWFAKYKKKLNSLKYGLLPLGMILACVGGLFVAQKDIGTLLIICATAFAIFLASNAPPKQIISVALIGIVAFGLAATFIPHVRQRVSTYADNKDPQGAGWQVRQSLIAVGSGGFTGKGYLQSVQRFSYLPEAHGDSIFAVASEELGFMGSALIVSLYVMFAIFAMKIANKSQDDFAMLLVVGFTAMIIVQSFLNIGSVLSLIPFTGEPLTFMSQGGTSLVIAMASVGIILNISRHQKQS